MKTFYEIQGYYPDPSKCSRQTINDPTTWKRRWETWMKTNHLGEARMIRRNGLDLIDPDCFTGFTRLRIVKVSEKRTVVPIK